jgi:hypothetical protein
MCRKRLPVPPNPSGNLFVRAGFNVDARRDTHELSALRAPLQTAIRSRIAGGEEQLLSLFSLRSAQLDPRLSLSSFYYGDFVVFQLTTRGEPKGQACRNRA